MGGFGSDVAHARLRRMRDMLSALFHGPRRAIEAWRKVVDEQDQWQHTPGRCGTCGESIAEDDRYCRACWEGQAW